MKTSLTSDATGDIIAPLQQANTDFARIYPGENGQRQPVHTVYGGAHLYKADTPRRLGALALRALEQFAPDADTFARAIGLNVMTSSTNHDARRADLARTIYARVQEKLQREPVEDFRIDFEDGYGNRPDAEEDAHAESAARELAKGLHDGTASPFTGIRIKPFTEELRARSFRTLDIFISTLVEAMGGQQMPPRFVVTLPKITVPAQCAALAAIFDQLEPQLSLSPGTLKMEMMIETTQSIINHEGALNLPLLLAATRGRCTAAHFGTYDYTASCNITAAHQHMTHPACDFAKHMMQVSCGGTGLWLSDGATNIMPVAPHRAAAGVMLTPAQMEENQQSVHRAWSIHYSHVQHSLTGGFYQGWDLHPAQLPTRYAAIYAFFLQSLDAASERLRNFVEKAAKATLVGDVFDDAATGQGLLNYFLRAINCGALTEAEALQLSSLTLPELRSGSFVKILNHRQKL